MLQQENDSDSSAVSESQIRREATNIRDSFLQKCKAVSQEKISSMCERLRSAHDIEFPSELPGIDVALEALQNVYGTRTRQQPTPCILKEVRKIPPYSAWAPVHKNFALHTLDEPYVPYFGDKPEEIAAATMANDLMLTGGDEQRSALDQSSDDDEVDGIGILGDNVNQNERAKGRASGRRRTRSAPPGSIAAIRLRAAQREAILEVTDKYGHEESVFEALATALDLHNAHRVKRVCVLARKRRDEATELKRRLRSSQRYSKQIRKAMLYPHDHESIGSAAFIGRVERTLHHFCFVCRVFCCDLHNRVRLVPHKEIPDWGLSKRLAVLKAQNVKYCSKRCQYLANWKQSPVDRGEGEVWSEEETQLLTEGLSIFKDDPCKLAVVIGSRCCREVWNKLNSASEKKKWRRVVAGVSAQHKFFASLNRKVAEEQNTHNDVGISSRTPLKESKSQKRKRTKTTAPQAAHSAGTIPRKTAMSSLYSSEDEDAEEEEEDAADDIAFLPCDHDGECFQNKSCKCTLRGRLCQPSCACNAMRYTEEHGRIIRKGTECGITQVGCDCEGGSCIGEECVCLNPNGTACNPDECSCDCRIPPWAMDRRSRKCKNIDVVLSRHKRTFVGRSFVEGFGLFAGEHFEEGDAVGEYVGGQWSIDKADQLLAVGHVMERTYAYDVMNVTVDGKMFGAKVKFINCSVQKEKQNCKPELVSVNGHYHLRLRATRDIKPGEEFLFNYGLNGAKSYTWLKEAKRQARLSSLPRNGSKECIE